MEPTGQQETKAIYFGVGIDTYSDEANYKPLAKAVSDVEGVGEVLKKYKYRVHLWKNCSKAEVEDKLQANLKYDVLSDGGSLIIHWSGHGEPTENNDLHLITCKTVRYSSITLKASEIARVAARTGANQILLIFDTCYSTRSLSCVSDIANQILQSEPPNVQDVWLGVVASAYGKAEDGVLGQKLIKLLRDGPDNPDLQGRWNSNNSGIGGDDLIDALVKELGDETSGQTIGDRAGGNAKAMFPNPLYKKQKINTRLFSLARGAELGDETDYFTGRATQIARIISWIKQNQPGSFIVTGPRGSGKSALLGRIVSLSNPAERTKIFAKGFLSHDVPGEGYVNVYITAVQMSAERLIEAIDEQLTQKSFLSSSSTGCRNLGELQDAILQTGRYPVIVIDDLSQAGGDVWRIAEDFLRTLAEVSLVLVATQDLRSRHQLKSLIETIGTSEVLDLGDKSIQLQTRDEVRTYITKRLSVNSSLKMDVDKIIEFILQNNSNHPEGLFLNANFITAKLRKEPVDTSLPNWEKSFAYSIQETFEKDISKIPPLIRYQSEKPQAARELITALAWAKGSGLPDDIWPVIATALSSTNETYERRDVFWLLPHVQRYIVVDGEDGRATYRLVYQWLLEDTGLIQSLSSEVVSDDGVVEVGRALCSYYKRRLKAGASPQSNLYLWKYLWQHCVSAGEEGVRAFRYFIEQDKEHFSIQLAQSLLLLGSEYFKLGRWQDAYSYIGETVELYSKVNQTEQEVTLELANALTLLGSVCLQLGRWQDSADKTEKAIALLEDMDSNNPAICLQFIKARTFLSLSYFQLGLLEEGVALAKSALESFNTNYSEQSAFSYELAWILLAVGFGYLQTSQHQEGISSLEEAIRLLSELDVENISIKNQLALAKTLCGQGYIQLSRSQEGISSLEEAIGLLSELDTENVFIRLQLALAKTYFGQGYIQLSRSQEGISSLEEAIGLLSELDTANISIRLQLALAKILCGQGYIQLSRSQEGITSFEEAIRILNEQDAENVSVQIQLSLAMFLRGQGYLQMRESPKGISSLEEAVDLLNSLNTQNVSIVGQLALYKTALGQSYMQVGQPHKGITSLENAVAILKTIVISNPLFLRNLVNALNIQCDCCRLLDREDEIELIWKGVLDSLNNDWNKAFLLIHKAQYNSQNTSIALTINDLLLAQDYLGDDNQTIFDFHRTCRALRSRQSDEFDSVWKEKTGRNIPLWLILEESYLNILSEWIRVQSVEASKAFLQENFDSIQSELTAIALDEISLNLGESIVEPNRNLLERVIKVGVDEAYRSWFAAELLDDWMSLGVDNACKILVERRKELVKIEIAEMIKSRLNKEPNNLQLTFYEALIYLAQKGKENLALEAIEDQAQTSNLLSNLASNNEISELEALSNIMFCMGNTKDIRALSLFYLAISQALRGKEDMALLSVTNARSLDEMQVFTWLSKLGDFLPNHPLISLMKMLCQEERTHLFPSDSTSDTLS